MPAAIESGLNVAVTPGSVVSADRATVPAAPMIVVLTALVGFGPPTIILIEVGFAEIEKSRAMPTP